LNLCVRRSEAYEAAVLWFEEAVVPRAREAGVDVWSLPRDVEAVASVVGLYVNGEDPPTVRRLTVAHELAHWVLGLDCGEAECTAFGAGLLMPKEDVERWVWSQRWVAGVDRLADLARRERSDRFVSRLARRYNTGRLAAMMALCDYGLLADRAPWSSYTNANYRDIETVYSELFRVS
jgi:Zn-dependent peptidase ImmA (M78 family)